MPTLRNCALTVATLTLLQAAPSRADEAAPAATTNTAAQADDIPRPGFGLCIGLGAGAVASLAAGIALGAVAKQHENEQNGNVNNPPVYSPSLNNRGKQGETFADVGYAFIGIGAALAVADLVLWIERYRPHHPKEMKTSLLSPVPGLVITPAALKVSF